MEESAQQNTFEEVVEKCAKAVAIDYLLGTNKLEESGERKEIEFNILDAISKDDEQALEQYTSGLNEENIIYMSTISMLNAMLRVMYAEIDRPKFMEEDEIREMKSKADETQIKEYLMKYISLDRFMTELSKELDIAN